MTMSSSSVVGAAVGLSEIEQSYRHYDVNLGFCLCLLIGPVYESNTSDTYQRYTILGGGALFFSDFAGKLKHLFQWKRIYKFQITYTMVQDKNPQINISTSKHLFGKSRNLCSWQSMIPQSLIGLKLLVLATTQASVCLNATFWKLSQFEIWDNNCVIMGRHVCVVY